MSSQQPSDVKAGDPRRKPAELPGEFSVAVVIPLFNKEQAIAQTLRSVLGQSRTPDELVVVDDGSADRSRAIAEEVLRTAATSIAWRIVHQANSGVSVARNRGVKETSSRFVAFLDSDDEWAAAYLAELERLATQFPDAAVLSAYSVVSDKGGALCPEPTPLSSTFFGLVERPLVAYRRGRGILNSSAIAIRRDAFEKAGGFPEGCACGEDIYLWLKLGMAEQFAHSGASLVTVHAEHSGNLLRQALIGHQFSYFLGTSEGRHFLQNEDLARFMSSQLLAQIVFRRMRGHSHVQAELKRLSRSLPVADRLKCLVAFNTPLWLLRLAKSRYGAARRQANASIEDTA